MNNHDVNNFNKVSKNSKQHLNTNAISVVSNQTANLSKLQTSAVNLSTAVSQIPDLLKLQTSAINLSTVMSQIPDLSKLQTSAINLSTVMSQIPDLSKLQTSAVNLSTAVSQISNLSKLQIDAIIGNMPSSDKILKDVLGMQQLMMHLTNSMAINLDDSIPDSISTPANDFIEVLIDNNEIEIDSTNTTSIEKPRLSKMTWAELIQLFNILLTVFTLYSGISASTQTDEQIESINENTKALQANTKALQEYTQSTQNDDIQQNKIKDYFKALEQALRQFLTESD